MSQASLFGDESLIDTQFEKFDLRDARLRYCADFFSEFEADRLFQQLQEEIPWRQHHIRIAGIERAQPRLSAWYGDTNAHYTYSGLSLHPLQWNDTLLLIKSAVEQSCGSQFNSVLLNLYRDQQDSMGWHADDETELGSHPTIASLSLGEVRDFLLKHKTIPALKSKIPLNHGSLLVMEGAMQAHWLHAIAKQKEKHGPRINLTFRQIHSSK